MSGLGTSRIDAEFIYLLNGIAISNGWTLTHLGAGKVLVNRGQCQIEIHCQRGKLTAEKRIIEARTREIADVVEWLEDSSKPRVTEV